MILSRDEVEALLEAPRNLGHRAMLATMHAALLRISEVAALKVRDLDGDRRTISVREGNGRKDRQVMLPDPLRELLAAYWKWKHPTEWLFPGNVPGQPVSSRTTFRACRSAARKAGLAKHVDPHSVQHAFATHLLEDGVNLAIIQVLLWHKSLKTIAQYLHAADAAVLSTRSPLESLGAIDLVRTTPPK